MPTTLRGAASSSINSSHVIHICPGRHVCRQAGSGPGAAPRLLAKHDSAAIVQVSTSTSYEVRIEGAPGPPTPRTRLSATQTLTITLGWNPTSVISFSFEHQTPCFTRCLDWALALPRTLSELGISLKPEPPAGAPSRSSLTDAAPIHPPFSTTVGAGGARG